MHQQILQLFQAVQMYTQLRVAPAGVLAHIAAAEAILGAFDLLLFADATHHVID